MDYLLHLAIVISIYSILAASLNLMWGFAGLLSFGHAAFFGIGAYASALLGVKLGLGFAEGTLLAVALTTGVGAIIAILTLRLGGDYFILAVLGFQVVISSVLFNWVDMTKGPFGLYGIKRPILFNMSLSSQVSYLLLTMALAIFLILLAYRLVDSPFGRLLKAIREDEVATHVLGKDVVAYKIVTFAVAAGFAAVAGSLIAHYFTVLHPSSFTLGESILIFAIVIVGGSGSLKGSVIGVVVLLLVPEALRFMKLPGDVSGPVQQVLYGFLLILFMLFRPQGLVGEYKL